MLKLTQFNVDMGFTFGASDTLSSGTSTVELLFDGEMITAFIQEDHYQADLEGFIKGYAQGIRHGALRQKFDEGYWQAELDRTDKACDNAESARKLRAVS